MSDFPIRTFCPMCRSVMKPVDRFCPSCGHDRGAVTPGVESTALIPVHEAKASTPSRMPIENSIATGQGTNNTTPTGGESKNSFNDLLNVVLSGIIIGTIVWFVGRNQGAFNSQEELAGCIAVAFILRAVAEVVINMFRKRS